MQVFIPYSEPLRVARTLDRRRLNKQIIECHQIIAVITGTSDKWKNHPVMKMYAPYKDWLSAYTKCLESYFKDDIMNAELWNENANAIRPHWMTDKICDQHKRRLYTKDPEFYAIFSPYGFSEMNYYIVGNEVWKYEGGFVGSESLDEFLNN